MEKNYKQFDIDKAIKELRIESDYEPTDYDIRRGLYKK